MNPESEKLERLSTVPGAEALEAKLAQLQGQLLRPDGTPVPKHWAVFTIGELVTVKDNTFKVAYMNDGALLLEPVPVDRALAPPEK